jgi:hypothetical protein
MLYETLLKKLKKRRASNLKGADGLTALEVSFCFSSSRNFLNWFLRTETNTSFHCDYLPYWGLKPWTYCRDVLRDCLSGTYIGPYIIHTLCRTRFGTVMYYLPFYTSVSILYDTILTSHCKHPCPDFSSWRCCKTWCNCCYISSSSC